MRTGNVFSLLLAVFSLTAQAQSGSTNVDAYEEYGKHVRAAQEVTPLTSTLFGDRVSLYNGATEFDVTDVDLPGNSSLPVRFGRRLEIDDRRQPTGKLGGLGEWDIDVPYISGVFTTENGWEVQNNVGQGGVYSRCSVVTPPYTVIASLGGIEEPAYQIWDGNQLHIPGETDEELLANTETALPDNRTTYPWITKSFYHASCAPSTANGYPGESFVVVSPSGVSYTFNWMVANPTSILHYQRPNPTGTGTIGSLANRSRYFLLATQVTDRFGNWVKYNYNASSQLQSITANDGREIDVTWSGNVVQSVSTPSTNPGPRTWRYGYVAGSDGYAANGLLNTVTRPDGSQWTYTVTSGSLRTLKDLSVDTPPAYHCQIDANSNTGSMVYTIGAPSGAQGVFSFTYQRNPRSYVPLNCTDVNPYTDYPDVYDFFDNFALVSKQISGAGLTPMNWSYDYASTVNGGGYVTANIPFPYPTETYIPQSSSAYHLPKVVTVTDPTGITKYFFGINYGVDEGRLLKTETYTLSGQMVRTVTNTYLPDNQIASQAFPDNAGHSVQPIYKNPMVGRIRPEVMTTTVQDGDTYTRQTLGFDVFAQATDVKRFNSIAGQQAIEEQTSYLNDTTLWVLGLPQQVTNVTTGEIESTNTYNSNDTLQSRTRFGQTLLTYTYNAAGQLASFTDGNSHTTSLSNYYRGIPQQINYPDNTSQTASVDNYGDILSVTDQLGHTTNYSYNAVGWPSQISYPAGDEVAWYPKNYTFAYVAGAERGIPGGHWRRTITTGNDIEVTYFDAMMRPLLSDSSIAGTAGSDITTASSFDWRGLTTFTSYPVSGTPDLSAVTSGSHKTYDTLGRPTITQQDSELGTLTTTTAYLPGAGVQVTDPKNNVTTTYAQVFDAPSYDAPIRVQAPASVTQTIARDLYGNPLSITQSGIYNGTESDSVTKTLTYDSYHRLCRTTEPESGSEVMAYDPGNNLAWSAAGLAITGGGCGREQVPTAAQTTRTYDAMNRVKTILPPVGTQSTSYGYDPAGRLTSAVSGISTWNGTYNFRGMLTGESLQLAGQNAWGLGYAHDAYGSLSLIHYPDGENVSYAPDALGRPTQAGSYATGVGYFPNGQVAQFTYANGASYVAAQNARQMLSNFSYGNGSTVQLSEDFAYDPNGNISTVTDLAGGPRNKSFGYDALNRLTSANAAGLWGAQTYTYDALNNLRTLQTGSQTSTYTYDPTNKLASISGAQSVSYTYDPRGNVATKNGTNLVFDQKNQLTQIAGSTYGYDASGRRVSKTAGGVTTYYFYSQSGQLMYQWAPGSALTTSFIYLGSKLVGDNETLVLGAPATIGFDANPNNGSYTVSWGAVTGATGYVLQESANGGGWVTVYSGGSPSVTLSGKAGGSYVYQVEGCAGTTCGGWTGSATLGVRPALPTVTVPGGTINGTYSVSWTAPPTATSYDVQERLNGGAWTTIASATTSTSISRPGNVSGSYTYQVAAYNTYGTRGWAGSAAVTVDITYGVLPTAPPSLAVPASSNNGSATLSWSATSLTTRYVVEQSNNGGTSWAQIYNSTGTSTAVSGLADGSYSYHVQSCNTYGCSAWTNGSATLVVTHPPTTAPILSVPASSTNGSYTVSWSGVAGQVSYTLQEQVNGGSWTTVQTNGMTSWSTSGRGNGTYGYHVQACNAGGCGPWSAVASTSVLWPPPTPASISAPGSSSGAITVTWATSATATSYTLQQSINGGGWTTVYSNAANGTTLNESSTGSYTLRVLACNTSGCSSFVTSGAVTVTIPPASAPGLSMPASNNTGSYTVSWSGVSGATSYTLQEQVNGGGWTTVQASGATSWGTSGRGNGTYGYQVQACNAGGCGPWSGTASVVVTIPVPIGINGNAYTVSDLIGTGNTGYSTIGFAIVGSTTWEVYGATPVGGNTVKASGAVPATAVTVQYTWTLIGPPAGDVDSGGTLSNGASSPTTLGSNPASYYTTSTYNARSGSRGRTYQLRVDFFNAAGANISSSTCTMTAETEGST